MKKRLLAVLLTAVMMLSVIGCGSGDAVKVASHVDAKKKISVTLGDYIGMALKGASDAEYQSNITSLINSFATTEEIDEAAEEGDIVNINYAGFLDDVAFEGGTDDSEEGFDLTLGSNSFIAGFEEGLIGVKKGESRDLNLTFPDPYTNNPDLAGKAVVFKVKVNAVKRVSVPELTDELAIDGGYESKADLEAKLKAELDKNAYQTTIAETLLETSKLEGVTDDEIQTSAEEFFQSYYGYVQAMASTYGMDETYVLYYMTGFTSPEEFRAYSEDYADRKVKYQYIVEAIYQKENLSYTEEEYKTRAMVYAESYGFETLEEFEADYTKEIVVDAIKMDIVIDYIIDKAQKF